MKTRGLLTAMSGMNGLAMALASRGAMLSNRVFGYENITRMIQQQGGARRYRSGNSIAGKPHLHLREKARNRFPAGSPGRARAYAFAKQGVEILP